MGRVSGGEKGRRQLMKGVGLELLGVVCILHLFPPSCGSEDQPLCVRPAAAAASRSVRCCCQL